MRGHNKKKIIIATVVSVLIVAVSIPVFAWFSAERKLGDLQRVDAPAELYIMAPHGDDIKYLRPDDIQVTSGTKKRYYAFCVSGTDADYYSLQLAYTTNNQFEYYLYPAKEVSSDSSYLASHTAHNDDGTLAGTYYYTIDRDNIIPPDGLSTSVDVNCRLQDGAIIRGESGSSANAITTGFLNKLTGQIKADSSLHDDTYKYGDYDSTEAQIYSEPIYWQAIRIKSGMDSDKVITDYYILEINWEQAAIDAAARGEELKDDRETDIIYIAVEATS